MDETAFVHLLAAVHTGAAWVAARWPGVERPVRITLALACLTMSFALWVTAMRIWP
ncbi:hypothetical protein [Arsenicicoccus dermatophilus]|uniref:hypothetical protein n=1 Tax=Arsenicicoccus dermatophilus TaxID=1076331 RepID=UPI001F4CD2B9|nr:hypothetical protein [Arsenicicoccus dermatophilus]MCH8612453.1 hypothetical protein [Arsenicicoccus dermatophilus]